MPSSKWTASPTRSGCAVTRSATPTNNLQEYQHRLGKLEESISRLARQDHLLIAAKVITGLAVFITGLTLARLQSSVLPVLFPLVLFVLLFPVHERVLNQQRRARRSLAFYQQGIARLENRWPGAGNRGERFLDPAHPYARDLDLFGQGGLFELLSSARTSIGEETLAAWLLAPSPVEEVIRRQSAVRELAPNLDFRERIALAGEEVGHSRGPGSLAAWSVLKDRALPDWTRVLLLLLAALWLFSMAAWAVRGWAGLAIGVSLANFAISYFTRARVVSAADSAEQSTREVALIAAVFAIVQADAPHSPTLVVDPPASDAFRRLARRADWLASRHNLFVRIFDGFIFFTPLCIAAIEGWRDRHGREVSGWMARLGEVEALSSLAGYAYEHPQNTWPEFASHAPIFHAESLVHPLLPPAQAVPNDLRLDENLRLLVISGPNMGGKSTLVRAVGLNAVLAQAGAPVPASQLRLSRIQVAASITVTDSLQGGLSRFYAEIKRLKQIEVLSTGALPVLFLLDELLSGTNSHDRRLGTEAVLKTLLSRGAIGLVTTHDLALTRIAEAWQGTAANAHFEDSIVGGELRFDYRLSPGVAHTTNALKLMQAIGLDVPLLDVPLVEANPAPDR